MSRLDDAIEQLYAAFADVQEPRKIEGCPCCIERWEIEVLLSRKVREISSKEMAPFASSALTTVGTVADYLYFLPRILHLNLLDESWWPCPEVTGGAITETQPQSWPEKRIEALRECFSAVVNSALAPDRQHMIDTWLCAIARAGFDVRAHLKDVATSRQAVLTYFEHNAAGLTKGRLTNPFWELPSEGHDAIVAWFHSKSVRQIALDTYGFVFEGPR